MSKLNRQWVEDKTQTYQEWSHGEVIHSVDYICPEDLIELIDNESSGLISIAEKLPELNQYCLVYTTNKGHRPINFTVTQYTKYGFEAGRTVTHWMALPSDPCTD